MGTNIDISRISTLDDFPSGKDKFKGSSHEKVADALLKVISMNQGGYAIGLEGSWGSGKSTVIKIAEEKLNKDDYVLFSFDTWAHQGDPIRRSFLECLFSFLQEKDIVSIRDWIVRLRKIRAQQKKVISETVPKVPFYNYLMVVYGLLLPFVVIWANNHFNSGDIFGIAITAFITISIPIVLALVTLGYRQWTDSEYKNLPVLPSTRYLSEKSKTEQYVHTEDATTIEFNRYFDDLIKKVRAMDKKLIVVLDNLDRLSPNSIKSMWGTMRNFFTSEDWSDRNKLLKNVYLIVPYDRRYISNVFAEDREDVSINGEGTSNRSVAGFIEKTFKMSFQVSQPVLTHWKGFFEEKLDKAFNKQLTRQQKYDLYKLFEFNYQEKGFKITPRRIKKFVNALVLQVIEWGDTIPIKYLGLYVLNKDSITLNYRSLIVEDLLDKRTLNYLTGEDWLKYLSAAHHKVAPNEAIQIVLSGPLKRALTSESLDELFELKKNDWFEIILNSVIEENSSEWASSEPETFSTVAKNLNQIELEDNVISKNIWEDLAKKVSSLKQIKFPSDDLAKGFGRIIRNTSKPHVIELGRNLYSRLYNATPDGSNIEGFTRNYIDFIKEINFSIAERVGEDEASILLKHVRLPEQPRFKILFSGKIHFDENLNLEKFNLEITEESFSKELRSFISEETIHEEVSGAVRSLLKCNININWSEITKVIYNRISNNNPDMAGPDFVTLLDILLVLRSEEKGNAMDKVNSLSSQGVLVSLADRFKTNELATSLILLELIRSYEKIDTINRNNNVPNYGDNQNGINQVRKVCSSPSDYGDAMSFMSKYACEFGYFHDILNAAVTNPERYSLPKALIIKMIKDGCIEGVNIYSIISDFSQLSFLENDKEIEKFFDLIDKKHVNVSEIQNINNISASFLYESITRESNIGQELVLKVQNYLSGYEPEEWESVLQDNRHELNLLFVLLDNNKKSFLSEDFSEALLSYSVDILDGLNSLPDENGRWNLLPLALPENTRRVFYRRLYDKLVSEFRESIYVYNLLRLFGKGIVNLVDASNHSDEFTENVLATLLNSDDDNILTWLLDNIAFIKQSFTRSSVSSKGHVAEIISTKGNEEISVKEKVASIANSLEISFEWEINGEEGNEDINLQE